MEFLNINKKIILIGVIILISFNCYKMYDAFSNVTEKQLKEDNATFKIKQELYTSKEVVKFDTENTEYNIDLEQGSGFLTNVKNSTPFKIIFNDSSAPIILPEGSFTKDKLPPLIFTKYNDIISFEIDNKYYALISRLGSEPRIYRGTYIIQNDNIFKTLTKISIVRNV
jgi:hypothetical protein